MQLHISHTKNVKIMHTYAAGRSIVTEINPQLPLVIVVYAMVHWYLYMEYNINIYLYRYMYNRIYIYTYIYLYIYVPITFLATRCHLNRIAKLDLEVWGRKRPFSRSLIHDYNNSYNIYYICTHKNFICTSYYRHI